MTDDLFRAWIQTLPSCLSRQFSEYPEAIGEGRNPACHVRRAGKSGTGYKAEYSCIPLTNQEHAYQHQFGELACLRKFTRNHRLIQEINAATPREAERLAAAWFDAQADLYFERWKRETAEGCSYARALLAETV